MRPALADKLKQISACAEELRARVEQSEEQLQTLVTSRDELQKRAWSQQRELHVLREQMEEYPELKRMNEHFRQMNADFEKRLRDVLSYTRALAAAFQQ